MFWGEGFSFIARALIWVGGKPVVDFVDARLDGGQSRFAIRAGLARRGVEHNHNIARLILRGPNIRSMQLR
jgi:hypothetical protein